MKKLFSIISSVVFMLAACTSAVSISTPQAGSELVYALADGRTIGDLVWSPTGQELAFVTFDPGNGKGQIYIVNLTTHAVRALVDLNYVRAPSWSPDGRHIAYNSLREIFIVPIDGSKSPESLTSGQTAAWSPSGKVMAIFDNADTAGASVYTLRIRNLETGTDKTIFSVNIGSHTIFDLSWSPDNTRLAFSLPPQGADSASAQRDIYIYNLETEKLSQFTNIDHNFFPTWSPSGGQIAYLRRLTSEPDASIIIAQVDSKCTIGVPGIDHVSSLAWSPNGSHLAYVQGTAIYLLDLTAVFGSDLVTKGPECP